MDDKSTMAYALLGLGLVALAENQPDALERILLSLRLRVESGGQLGQTSSLIGMACQAMHEGNARQAARLLGAVDAAIRAIHGTVEPELIPFHAKTLAAVMEQLGASAFQSAWDEGAGWTLEEAVARVGSYKRHHKRLFQNNPSSKQ